MTMKRRIFISNTAMVLISLLILFGIGGISVLLFKEEFMKIIEQNAQLPDETYEVELCLKGQQDEPKDWETLSQELAKYEFELYVSDFEGNCIYSNAKHSEKECIEELEGGEFDTQAHLKRYERLTHITQEKEEDEQIVTERVVTIGNVRIYTKSWKVYKNETVIKFPHREFELLKFLALNPNIVFSKEALFEKIWGYDYVGDSATVMVHINRIREKIEDEPKNPQIIETIWGAGYRLNMK